MSEKLTGYALLAAGIGVMVFAVVTIYLVFTNKTKPYPLFQIAAPSLNVGNLLPSLPQNEILGLPQQLPNTNLELLPSDTINNSLNITAHFFLMSFILTFGFKLANLGVMLLRPMVVKVKAREVLTLDEVKAEPVETASVEASAPSTPPPSST